MPERIHQALIVEHHLRLPAHYAAALSRLPIQVTRADNLSAGLAQIASLHPAVIVLCERKHSGALMPLSERLAALGLSARIVVLVQQASVRSATAAFRHGAGDYLSVREPAAHFAVAVERLLAESASAHTPNTAGEFDAKDGDELAALMADYELLQSQMRDRDDFLSLVSHELRTPLMAVSGYLELLKKYADRLPPDKLQEFIGRSLRATGELTYLADMLMFLVHLETADQRLAIVPVPLAPIAMTAIDQCMALVAGHQITHDIPAGLAVMADEVALQQVLRNLLSNAVKYSPDGGRVHLSARSADGTVRISVRDEGIGMTEGQIAHLFTRFSRVHDAERWPDIHGTGLGLYLCRRIVTSLDGDIRVESAPGHGSTFSVTLPAAISANGEVALALAGERDC